MGVLRHETVKLCGIDVKMEVRDDVSEGVVAARDASGMVLLHIESGLTLRVSNAELAKRIKEER